MIWIGVLVVSFLAMGSLGIYRAHRDLASQPRFPSRREVEILHEERWVSGCSHFSWFTKIGGARNCLRLVVTTDELWIRPHWPISWFAAQMDLCHRIKRSSIVNAEMEVETDAVVLRYTDGDGASRMLTLFLRRVDPFLAAIGAHSRGEK
ncbi:MAG: hypothetical protein AAFU85_30485 [Planctomycetota bacterium]